jgi:glyoxalase family protein
VGIEGACAYAQGGDAEEPLLTETLGFTYEGAGSYLLQGGRRSFRWAYDEPAGSGLPGAGTVHHIAWATEDDDQVTWQQRVADAGGRVTPVQDRDYFRAIYFREPRGILFEIATLSPGFAADEDPDRLGEQLRVPKMHAHRSEELERTLKPVVNPRARRRVEA